MKNKANFKRIIALLLCLVMVVSMLPTAAFADDETGTSAGQVGTNEGTNPEGTEGNDADAPGDDAEDPEPGTPEPDPIPVESISPAEGAALIPEDAKTEVTETTENGTYTETTETTWGSTTETKGNYEDNKTVIKGDDVIVDKLADGNASHDDIEGIKDGTYTKTETETKTDVKVDVEGDQTQIQSQTREPDGFLSGDSSSVEGQQTTTTTTTDFTKVTTTTVDKKTGEDLKTGEEPGKEDTTDGKPIDKGYTDGQKTTKDTEKKDLDKVEVDLGDDLSDLFNDLGVSSDKLTVSAGNKTATSAKKDSTSVKTDAVTNDLLIALNGWTVETNGQKVTVNVDDDGNITYTGEDGEAVDDFKVTLVQNGNKYSIVGTKSNTTIVESLWDDDAWDDQGKKGDNEKGERSEITWNDEGYVLTESGEDEDGNKIYKYVKTGTATRTDTNEWLEVHTRKDGVTEIVQTATASATLTNGDYTVKATWLGVTPEADANKNNDDVVITVLGPSQKVLQVAVQNRKNAKNESKDHTISANLKELAGYLGKTEDQLKNMNANQIAALLKAKTGNANAASAGSLTLVGGVLQSTILINDASNKEDYRDSPWLRLMKDEKGNYFYVYCAEHGKKDVEGASYDIVNVEDHAVEAYRENANHIQYVVENGWWGTESGVGSLTEVKKLVSDKQAKELDDGIALAVTQAAIWYYTSGDADKIPDTDVFLKCWGNGNAGSYKNLSDKQKDAAMALFNALIQKDKTEAQMASKVNNTTDFIHEDDITETSIQVVKKVENVDELTALVQQNMSSTTNQTNAVNKLGDKEVYQANVSVTLAVVPSKLNSNDMIVYVYSGDTVVGSKHVTQKALEENNGTLTIENVTLENGATVKFRLDGTQYLADGAYLFSTNVTNGQANGNTGSQTMVGYVSGGSGVSGSTQKHKVDLTVNMKFEVTTNKASAIDSSNVSGKTTTYDRTHTQEREQESTTEVTESYEKTVIVKTTVETDESSEDTVEAKQVVWRAFISNTYDRPNDEPTPTPEGDDDDDVPELPEPEIPLNELPDEDIELPDDEIPLDEMPDEEVELPDDEIPLADVPQTGDISGAWYVMAALSTAGLMALVTIERKKSQDDCTSEN